MSVGLAFCIRMAKASNAPVVVITTSGTAVANLYPAVIEASLTQHKLIVISADRPQELIGCGVNQAIEQPGIFANYPVATLNLPKASPDYAPNWLVWSCGTSLCHAKPTRWCCAY